MNPTLIQFRCRLTQPFHSRGHQFSNLYTVSEWILGSTLRGAILRALIDEQCTRIEDLQRDNPGFHAKCEEFCAIRPLFFPPTRVSFGHFEKARSDKGMRTRVGIDRHRFSAAEGRLLSMEVWQYGVFRFVVMLPTPDLIEPVRRAVEQVGGRPDDIGIGGFRGIGYGKFDLLGCETLDLPAVDVGDTDSTTYRFHLKTPYVLDAAHGGQLPPDTLTSHLNAACSPESAFPFTVKDVDVTPTGISYIRRWSDETKQKLNRVVLDPGSVLTVTFDQQIPERYLQLWQLGVGEWFYSGFGASEIRAER